MQFRMRRDLWSRRILLSPKIRYTTLMHLADSLEKTFRLTDIQKTGLKRLGLHTVRDVLFYFPSRYSHITEIKHIRTLESGTNATVYGTIEKTDIKKGYTTKMIRAHATLRDLRGDTINLVWFNQPYIAKMLTTGISVEVTGHITESKYGLTITNPEWKKIESVPMDVGDSLFTENNTDHVFGFPMYHETKGVTSKWLYHAVSKILKSGVLETIPEYIDADILKKYSLPKLQTALVWIHTPKTENDARAAQKRFSFEEIFFIQIARKRDRQMYLEKKSYSVTTEKKDLEDFIRRFPFTPTAGQHTAINHILEDMAKPTPMARLLEGDVGSGKTAVAAVASYATIMNRPDTAKGIKQTFGNLQVAYMAPTEILATQHFENFIQYFTHTGISIGLMTSSGCRKFPSKVASNALRGGWTNISRTQLLKWVENGEIPILIGTHALIQKSVKFKHLALAIVDEQHRFGAAQRAKLARDKGFAPHFLSMTATPIPRTLALTIYGDLDLTLLDELPAGRKQIETSIVHAEKRDTAYDAIRKELQAGRQLYVICPRIADPDEEQEVTLNLKSVTSEAKRLHEKVFPEYDIDILHSKMTKEQKEKVMQEFSTGATDILVATSVVEVGVNVPNATNIIIEGSERFGLSQLHQLRGRVMRSSHQPYCYLFTDSKNEKTRDRLNAFLKARNGFELAELDLSLRGAGELSGVKQWGITDLGMEAIKNIKLVQAAREEATKLIASDPNLANHPLLARAYEEKQIDLVHFE